MAITLRILQSLTSVVSSVVMLESHDYWHCPIGAKCFDPPSLVICSTSLSIVPLHYPIFKDSACHQCLGVIVVIEQQIWIKRFKKQQGRFDFPIITGTILLLPVAFTHRPTVMCSLLLFYLSQVCMPMSSVAPGDRIDQFHQNCTRLPC